MNESDKRPEIPESDIREELRRILRSPIFVQSERLSRFIRFTVEAVLTNKSDALKEFVIGTEVYDRQPPYHPSQDSIVRTEARRLRGKLREYYESEGKTDQVLIYFRPGSYAPVFRLREQTVAEQPESPQVADDQLFTEGRGISIAVVPFESSSGELAPEFAAAITDELIHELMRTEGLRVTSAASPTPLDHYGSQVPALAAKLGVHLFFEGSVRYDGRRLRVTARIITADGFQLWSQRYETEPAPDQLFDVAEHMALSLINRTRPEVSSIRKLNASAGAGILNSYTSVLRAEALIEEGTIADVHTALLNLEELHHSQPAYPRPLCSIAQCWYELALRGAGVSRDQLSAAQAKARRARELDPAMIQAHGCAAALSILQWNWKAADEGFQQALRLGSQVATYRQYALFLAVQKRFDESWSYLQRAQQMDAFSNRQKIACARFFYTSRRYAEIDRHFPARLNYGPLPLEALLFLALSHVELGRLDEARRITGELRHQIGAEPTLAAFLVEVLARSGDMSQATTLVADLGLLSTTSGISKFRQSLLAAALADESSALNLLSEAYDNREPELIWVDVETRLDALRAHPRFVAISRSVITPR